MAGEWTTFRLGDVCSKIGSGATPRGGSSVYLDHGDVTLIRSQNIYNDGFHHDGITYLTEEHAGELANVEVAEHDVLLNITGDSVARSCQVDADVLPARVNQHVAIIRPNPAVLWPRFLRYFLVSPTMRAHMLSLAGAGATRNALTKGMIESFEVQAPKDVDEQRAIAHILGTLDDKIELNRRMNETLEAMARALFKSWFVDFDPVRAKAERRDPGLPKPLADLFPNSFEDSELGKIPKGWSVCSAYDLATYINGAAYRAFEPNEDRQGLPIIKIAELKAGVTSQTRFSAVDMPQKYRIGTGDILFSWSGNPDTSIDIFVWPHGSAWLNQHIFRVVPSSNREKAFMLQTLRFLCPVFAEVARNKQTTGLGHVTVEDLKRLCVVRPPVSVLSGWNTLAEPLHARSFGLFCENNTLAALRDTLLSKLISGELRTSIGAKQ
jgi:type I restriction enzyme S subunit